MVGARSGAAVLVLPTSVGGAGTKTYEQLIDTLIDKFVSAAKQAKP
jgi:hypothetical protein